MARASRWFAADIFQFGRPEVLAAAERFRFASSFTDSASNRTRLFSSWHVPDFAINPSGLGLLALLSRKGVGSSAFGGRIDSGNSSREVGNGGSGE